MKNILAIILLVLCTSTIGMAAEQHSFIGRYQFESSDRNTSDDETSLSVYKDSSFVFFRNDTAYSFQPQNNMNMGDPVECEELKYMDIYGSFAYDAANNKMYFVRKTSGNNTELLEATDKDDRWTNLKNLKMEGLNSVKNEVKKSRIPHGRYNFFHDEFVQAQNLSLGKNGKRLYFSAILKDSVPARCIWYSDLNEQTGVWSRPKSVGDEVNTGVDVDYPFVINDSLMYYASKVEGGQGGYDLYKATLDTSINKWTHAQNLDLLVNTESNEYNIVEKNNAIYFLSDRASGKGGSDVYYPLKVKVNHCVELLPQNTIDRHSFFTWVLFFFDFNKYGVKPEYETQIDELVSALEEFPYSKLIIKGFTDSRGSNQVNMKLSQQRADFVKEMLIKRGIADSKMRAVGKGYKCPIVPNAVTEFEHEQNRRVEIYVIEDKSNSKLVNTTKKSAYKTVSRPVAKPAVKKATKFVKKSAEKSTTKSAKKSVTATKSVKKTQGKAVTKSAAKQAVKKETKPKTKSMAKPAVKTKAKPVKKTSVKPATQSVKKSVTKPKTKSMAKPAVKTKAKPVKKTSVKPTTQSVKKSVTKPTTKSVVKPVEKTRTKTVKKTSVNPTVQSSKKSVVKPKTKSMVKPAEKTVTKSVKKPVVKSAANSAKKSAVKPSTKTAKKTAVKPVKKNTIKTTSKSVKKTTVKRANKTVAKPTVKTATKSVKKATGKTVIKTANKTENK